MIRFMHDDKVISSVRLSGRYRLVVTGILVSVFLTIVGFAAATTEVSLWSVLPVLVVVLLAGVLVLALRAEIATTADAVVIRIRPLYTKQLPIHDIISVSPAASTGVVQGFGYRILGKNRRGLLVGGPGVHIETQHRTWVVSCQHPTEAMQSLHKVIEHGQDQEGQQDR